VMGRIGADEAEKNTRLRKEVRGAAIHWLRHHKASVERSFSEGGGGVGGWGGGGGGDIYLIQISLGKN